MFHQLIKIILTFAVLPLFVVAVFASEDESDLKSIGFLTGTTINAESGEAVGWSSVLIDELNRSVTAHSDGAFLFRNVPEGRFNLKVYRIGYENYSTGITISAGDTTHVVIELRETVFRSAAVEVVDRQREDQTTETEMVLSGRQLRQQLSRTISETLLNEPGINQRSMGPAPSRPVLRGLGGERLLILEDGRRTGDLSATSSDHAVSIESMTADQIELIRGPSALVYGSNTQGGVINVRRGQIPREIPDHFHGSVGTQVESVNTGITGGFNLSGGLGPVAFRLDGSARTTGDIYTPEGTLDNTYINTYNGSAGISLIQSWGSVGVSGSIYDTSYGIPGGFMGGHPNGVEINMLRRFLQFQIEYTKVGDYFRRLELEGNYAYYYHAEIEFPERLDFSILGSEFGVLTTNFRFNAHHNGLIGDRGMFGLWGEHRDYAAGGGFFTPPTIERGVAAYVYERLDLDRWKFEGSLRYDIREVNPRRITETMTDRQFQDVSGSVSATYTFDRPVQVGTMLMRSFRAPGIEELYSDGPHVASFSFEVGNPNLDKENGYGIELFVKYSTTRFRGRLAVFRNQFSGFIFPENTGQPSPRRNDLFVYRYEGVNALMTGAEAGLEWRVYNNIVTSGTISFVKGDIIQDGQKMPVFNFGSEYEPLPMVPPLFGRFGLEYRRSNYSFGANTRFAFEQTRTGQFEDMTNGYAVMDLFGEWSFSTGDYLHTITASLENVFNDTYRMHLSRIKSIMPEPGRNLKILYRFYF